MNKTRCLGLLGGLGVGATVHYYQALAKACEEQKRTLDIVIAHAETARVFERVQANDRDGLATYLLGFTDRLRAAGAELIAIPAVTAHFSIKELVARFPLPVISIFDPLIKELAARGARRVAVFGTRYVMESGLFGLAGPVEIVPLSPDEVNQVHAIYAELAQTGKASSEQYEKLTAIAHTLLARDAVEAIILAGTDLALLFNESNTDFPHIDCAALHIHAILQNLE